MIRWSLASGRFWCAEKFETFDSDESIFRNLQTDGTLPLNVPFICIQYIVTPPPIDGGIYENYRLITLFSPWQW